MSKKHFIQEEFEKMLAGLQNQCPVVFPEEMKTALWRAFVLGSVSTFQVVSQFSSMDPDEVERTWEEMQQFYDRFAHDETRKDIDAALRVAILRGGKA